MATGNQLELALRLKAAVEGVSQIAGLAQEIEDLGGDASAVKDQAGALADELANLARQQTVIEVFKKVSASASEAGNQLAELQQKSAGAGAEQDRLKSNLAAAQQALEGSRASTTELGAAVNRASIEVKEANARYLELRAATKAAGTGNDELKIAVAAARAELDQKKRSLSENSAALKEATSTERQLEAAVREDEAAIVKQTQAIVRLKPEIDKAEDAKRALTAEVERSSNALKFAGIDARNLAAEEQRVTRETIVTKNAVSQLSVELQEQRDQLKGQAQSAAQAAAETRRFGNDQQDAEKKAGGLGGTVGGLIKRLGALVAVYLGFNEARRALVSVLQTGDQFEIFQKQLAATFGTAEQGQAAFEWVREFAKNTPLELDQVLEATIQLKNFGLDPLDGTLQALVDQNAKSGGSYERLQRIITATGQAFAKGRIQGEELLQFAEAGVPVFDLLSKSTGKTTAEVIKLAEEGRLGRDVLRDLIKAIGDNAAGAAAAQMETLSGRVSNAKDNYQQFLDVVANNGPLQLAKEEISDIGTALQDSDTAARVVGQSLVAVVQSLFALGNVGAAVAKSFKLAFDGVGSAVSSVLAGIALGLSKITFGDLSRQFAEAADALFIRSRELADATAQDAESIRRSYGDAYERLGNAVGAGVEVVKAANGEISTSAKSAAAEQTAAAAATSAASAAREKAAQLEAEALQRVRVDAKALGVDYSLVTTGISEDTAKRISALNSLAENGAETGAVITAAFQDALNAATTQEEARAIGDAVKGIEKPAFDTAAAVAKVGERVRELPIEAERANTALNEAFKTLGIVSKAELERAAIAAEQAFERIRESGTATTTQLGQAYADVAEKRLALAAADGKAALEIEAANLRAKAVTDDQAKALDAVIAKYPVLAEAGSKALKGIEESGKPAVDVLQQLKAAIAGAEEVQQLDDLRSALLRAYNEGRIAAEEYEAAVLSITEKQKELERAADGAREGAASALAGLVTGNQAAFRALSDEAGAAFDRIVETSGRAGITSVMQFIENFNRGLASLNRIRDEQAATADSLIERLANVRTATEAVIRTASGAAESLKFVDAQRLDQLNAAIDSARSRLDALRSAAQNTLASVQDELDRVRGNTDAIEQRRRDAQRAEIEAQLKAAKTAGDRQAIEQLQQSLALLEQIGREKDRAAQQDRQQAAANATTQRTTAAAIDPVAAAPNKVTRIEFVLPGSSQVITGDFDDEDASAFLRLLGQAKAVSTT